MLKGIIFKEILLVALGGALGSVCRYLLSALVQQQAGTVFPIGTMSVNVAGCLLIGVVTGWAGGHTPFSAEARLLLVIGFCGGFTTFSTFANESLSLYHGHVLSAALYIGGSVMLGILSAALGLQLGRML